MSMYFRVFVRQYHCSNLAFAMLSAFFCFFLCICLVSFIFHTAYAPTSPTRCRPPKPKTRAYPPRHPTYGMIWECWGERETPPQLSRCTSFCTPMMVRTGSSCHRVAGGWAGAADLLHTTEPSTIFHNHSPP